MSKVTARTAATATSGSESPGDRCRPGSGHLMLRSAPPRSPLNIPRNNSPASSSRIRVTRCPGSRPIGSSLAAPGPIKRPTRFPLSLKLRRRSAPRSGRSARARISRSLPGSQSPPFMGLGTARRDTPRGNDYPKRGSLAPSPTYNRVFVSGNQNGGVIVNGQRSGSAGNLLAPEVVDPLITHSSAGMERARIELDRGGNWATLLPQRSSLSLRRRLVYCCRVTWSKFKKTPETGGAKSRQ